MTPIAKDAAAAYRDRWPAWAHETFTVEPSIADDGAHCARIGCGSCSFEQTVPIDLRADPSPTLLRALRIHMDRHGYVPLAERK